MYVIDNHVTTMLQPWSGHAPLISYSHIGYSHIMWILHVLIQLIYWSMQLYCLCLILVFIKSMTYYFNYATLLLVLSGYVEYDNLCINYVIDIVMLLIYTAKQMDLHHNLWVSNWGSNCHCHIINICQILILAIKKYCLFGNWRTGLTTEGQYLILVKVEKICTLENITLQYLALHFLA